MFDQLPASTTVSLASSAVSTVSGSEILGLICFVLALLHTFAASRLKSISHFLSETELAFPLWGVIFLASVALGATMGWLDKTDPRNQFVELATHLDFSEPAFVFAILLFTNTPPVMRFAGWIIDLTSAALKRISGLTRGETSYIAAMVLGPLLGSLITEPAAMTVTALFLRDRFFERDVSHRFKFMSFANLLVNVSIGGALTNFAAPPILMVRDAWGWSTGFIFFNFGIHAALAIALNTAVCWFVLRKELKGLGDAICIDEDEFNTSEDEPPVLRDEKPNFLSLITRGVGKLEFRSSLFVALFLAGVVILGHQQAWWLRTLIENRPPLTLFLGATALTAVTDNAALTYLSTQIASLTPAMKHAVVAGSIAGGGLTIVANAPNPIGFSILRDDFGGVGLGVGTLLRYALLPTLIAMICLWIF